MWLPVVAPGWPTPYSGAVGHWHKRCCRLSPRQQQATFTQMPACKGPSSIPIAFLMTAGRATAMVNLTVRLSSSQGSTLTLLA